MGAIGDAVSREFYTKHLNGFEIANSPTKNRQDLITNMYMRVLTELAVNRFKWIGLPDTVDARFLEMSLFTNALCLFYWDSDYSRYLALRASGSGRRNMYDNPTEFTVWGAPGFTGKRLGPTECVPIWANYMRVPDLDIVTVYATKLADIDRTIEINSHNMRYTKAINSDENSVLSWTNILKQYDGGEPLLLGTKGMDFTEAKTLDLGVEPRTLDGLMLARTQMWNQCMTLLGINNANQDKKERLVADEVAANDEQVSASKSVNINARRQACEQINRIYPGLEVHVDFTVGVDPMIPSFAMGDM